MDAPEKYPNPFAPNYVEVTLRTFEQSKIDSWNAGHNILCFLVEGDNPAEAIVKAEQFYKSTRPNHHVKVESADAKQRHLRMVPK